MPQTAAAVGNAAVSEYWLTKPYPAAVVLVHFETVVAAEAGSVETV